MSGIGDEMVFSGRHTSSQASAIRGWNEMIVRSMNDQSRNFNSRQPAIGGPAQDAYELIPEAST